jgi:hypothetical protein
MSGEVENYIAATEICEGSAKRVDILIEKLRHCAVPLIEGWLYCRALDDKETAMRLRDGVFATTMPSLQEIQDALAQYIEAETGATAAWDRLAVHEQGLLTPPAWQRDDEAGLLWSNQCRGKDDNASKPAAFEKIGVARRD